MDLLEDSKLLPLDFNFFMICMLQKMLVSFKNDLNHLKNSIFKCFLRSAIDVVFFILFCITCGNGKFEPRKIKHNKRCKKETKKTFCAFYSSLHFALFPQVNNFLFHLYFIIYILDSYFIK